MNRINKFFTILTLLTIVSGCGVKEDIEKSVKNEKIKIETSSKLISQFEIPLEQANFQSTLLTFPKIPLHLQGTREGDALDQEKKNFTQKWKIDMLDEESSKNIFKISGWICVASGKQDEAPMNGCNPVNSDNKLSTIIGFLEESKMPTEKYYKGDILKVSGTVVQSNFGNDFLYQFLLKDAEVEIIKKN